MRRTRKPAPAKPAKGRRRTRTRGAQPPLHWRRGAAPDIPAMPANPASPGAAHGATVRAPLGTLMSAGALCLWRTNPALRLSRLRPTATGSGRLRLFCGGRPPLLRCPWTGIESTRCRQTGVRHGRGRPECLCATACRRRHRRRRRRSSCSLAAVLSSAAAVQHPAAHQAAPQAAAARAVQVAVTRHPLCADPCGGRRPEPLPMRKVGLAAGAASLAAHPCPGGILACTFNARGLVRRCSYRESSA